MFLDEARISARIRHRNVVSIIDVVEHDAELFLVMEYVHGVSLAVLCAQAKELGESVPLDVAVAITLDILDGLQAAHEATTEDGRPLEIVHRDVSPQNVMVGTDGMARVVDFGIAKAAVRSQTTREGQLKGKLRYMAPEQFLEREIDTRTDVYSAAVVLWELATGHPLVSGSSEGAIVAKVLEGVIAAPSRISPHVPAALDAIVLRGLAREPEARFASAREMATALRDVVPPAAARDVGHFVERVARAPLADRARLLASAERNEDESLKASASPASEPRALTLRPTDLSTKTIDGADLAPRLGPKASSVTAGRVGIGIVAASFIALLAFAIPRSTGRIASPEPSLTAKGSTSAALEPPSVSPSSSAVSTLTVSDNAASTSEKVGADALPRKAPKSGAAAGRNVLRPRATVEPPTKGSSSLRPGCNPMFSVDANGIRRVKPECL